MATIWAAIKLILKIFALLDSIQEQQRVKWLNDCSDAFDRLKYADTAEKKLNVASDIAKLIRKI